MLVSIKKVNEIVPIEGVDNIQLAHIDGWQKWATQKPDNPR